MAESLEIRQLLRSMQPLLRKHMPVVRVSRGLNGEEIQTAGLCLGKSIRIGGAWSIWFASDPGPTIMEREGAEWRVYGLDWRKTQARRRAWARKHPMSSMPEAEEVWTHRIEQVDVIPDLRQRVAWLLLLDMLHEALPEEKAIGILEPSACYRTMFPAEPMVLAVLRRLAEMKR